MRIGIFGAYDRGFLCDDLLYQAISQAILKEKPDTYLFPYPARDEFADCYLIAGGTILGTPLGELPSGKPFAVFGAGYRGSEHIEKLKKAVIVMVRGLHTVEQLKRHDVNAMPCGDPIFLLDIPDKIERVYNLGLVPRSKGWAKNPQHYIQWLSQFTPDCVINMHLTEDDCDGSKYSQIFHPQNVDEALRLILSCKKLVSARLHPYLIALRAGIPCHFYDIEFNKGEDAISGLPYWPTMRQNLRNVLSLLEEACHRK